MKLHRHLPRCLAALGICLAVATASPAATITWTGAAGTSYTDAGNWSGGVAPTNSDWNDIARFTENSPANKTPNLSANRLIRALIFDDSTGWTFSGSQMTLRYVTSTGAGTNTITAPLKTAYSGTWTVSPDNTLELAGGLYQDMANSTIHLDGGGTMILASRINSWSSALQTYIDDGLLRIEDSVPYANAGADVYIQSTDAFLQLETTVAAATNLIGTRILDGVGNGLTVTDVGGGFVEIASLQLTAVPEPSTLLSAFLAILGLAFYARRHKRN